MPEAQLAMGFDFGQRRIGVAVGQRITGTATAVAVIRHGEDGPDWPAADQLLRSWRPQVLIVGLPLARDGGEQAMTVAARAFGAALHSRYGLPVRFEDERFTSRAANDAFVAARRAGLARRKQAAELDAQAARRIVEQWLQSPENPS